MDNEFYTALVDVSIADLIPEYMNNRRAELELLRTYLDKGEMDKIAGLAHRMIGVGTPYGFHHVTNMAKLMREVAQQNDTDTLRELLKEYEHYVRNVTVKVVDLSKQGR